MYSKTSLQHTGHARSETVTETAQYIQKYTRRGFALRNTQEKFQFS